MWVLTFSFCLSWDVHLPSQDILGLLVLWPLGLDQTTPPAFLGWQVVGILNLHNHMSQFSIINLSFPSSSSSLSSILLVLFLYRAPATLTLFFQLLSLLAEGDTATWMFPVCPGSLTCLFCTWGGQPRLASAGLHMDEGQTLRHPWSLRRQETVRHSLAIVQASRAGTEASGHTMTPDIGGLEIQIREYIF